MASPSGWLRASRSLPLPRGIVLALPAVTLIVLTRTNTASVNPNGELHASPRPASRHVRAESVLGRRIGGPFDDGVGGPGGWWILDEPELHVQTDVLVPDLPLQSLWAELDDPARRAAPSQALVDERRSGR